MTLSGKLDETVKKNKIFIWTKGKFILIKYKSKREITVVF